MLDPAWGGREKAKGMGIKSLLPAGGGGTNLGVEAGRTRRSFGGGGQRKL